MNYFVLYKINIRFCSKHLNKILNKTSFEYFSIPFSVGIDLISDCIDILAYTSTSQLPALYGRLCGEGWDEDLLLTSPFPPSSITLPQRSFAALNTEKFVFTDWNVWLEMCLFKVFCAVLWSDRPKCYKQWSWMIRMQLLHLWVLVYQMD